MEFCGSCVVQIGSEFAPVGEPPKPLNGISLPMWVGSRESKNAPGEFWESGEFLISILGSSYAADTPFLDTFAEVLSISEKFSFYNARTTNMGGFGRYAPYMRRN